jgi:5-methylcytosine-specific restriction endonuclease McrA
VLKRDRGICALCDIDTVAMRRKVMKLPLPARTQALRELAEQGLIGHTRKSWWEADHILPVAEGGDSNIENLRTLCRPCHRGVTTELRLRLRRKRLLSKADQPATSS